MAGNPNVKQESTVGTILGWGFLAVFSIAFAWYVGAPLIMGERWADKKNDAIDLVRNSKPIGSETLYDMIRAYTLKAKEQNVYVGEFNWDAIQREGPQYEVTLLWTEGSERKVAVWRVNLQTKEIRPQGNEASSLPKRLAAEVPPAA
jgi:hypothetical protein